MSSFDSMIRVPSSARCFSSQSASTSASGCAYSVGVVLMRESRAFPSVCEQGGSVAERVLQPVSAEPKSQTEEGAGRFLERFKNAGTEVLLRLIDCSGQ